MRTLVASTAIATLALFSVPASAQTSSPGGSQMTGTGQFCLKSMAGQAQCNYQTMAQCEQARPSGSSDQCVDKSQVSGTTGSGAASPSSPGGSGAMPPPDPKQ